jgi:hypothetical protein
MSRYWERSEGVIMKESFFLKRYCHFMSMEVAMGEKRQKKKPLRKGTQCLRRSKLEHNIKTFK